MASTRMIENVALGNIASLRAVKGGIRAEVFKMPAWDTDRNIALSLEGLTPDEARIIIAKVIEVEQARGGAEAILSPTEYANRFSGLDFE